MGGGQSYRSRHRKSLVGDPSGLSGTGTIVRKGKKVQGAADVWSKNSRDKV